ncbi:unnamed protein product [Trifolium pratense]|uniref:Uncharacterized protein n=1 Tax=Trifolium pratense TaxID=57577 RepID=A0ACB0J340_TRIPR|nr:unnamed protein product [Trifolium pratense]
MAFGNRAQTILFSHSQPQFFLLIESSITASSHPSPFQFQLTFPTPSAPQQDYSGGYRRFPDDKATKRSYNSNLSDHSTHSILQEIDDGTSNDSSFLIPIDCGFSVRFSNSVKRSALRCFLRVLIVVIEYCIGDFAVKLFVLCFYYYAHV